MNIKNIAGLILDADGVLFNGDEEIGDLEKAFKLIRESGLQVTVATNSTTRDSIYYVERLASYGANLEANHVVTSAVITADYLHQMFPQGAPIYAIGEKALIDALLTAGFYSVEQTDVVSVVVGLDRYLTYEKLKKAAVLIRNGARFIAANRDLTIKNHEGLIPAAGAIVAALEAATGIAATVMGKPQTSMYNHALSVMGLEPHQVLVVGDQLTTDIACAQTLGCQSALVFSGVTDRKSAESWEPSVNIIANDLNEVLNLLVKFEDTCT